MKALGDSQTLSLEKRKGWELGKNQTCTKGKSLWRFHYADIFMHVHMCLHAHTCSHVETHQIIALASDILISF